MTVKKGYYVEYKVCSRRLRSVIMSGDLYSKTPTALKQTMRQFRDMVKRKHAGQSEVKYGPFFMVKQIKAL
jgi:hypothetical protein